MNVLAATVPTRSIVRRARSDERGFGLVELLIALMVLNIGIFATIAAFNTGVLTLRRASHVSAAGALADKDMEKFRSMSYSDLAAQTNTTGSEQGPDGRTYTVDTSFQAPASQTPAPATPYGSGRPAIVVTILVSDPQDNGRVLVRAGSSFDQCTQDRTSGACGVGAPS